MRFFFFFFDKSLPFAILKFSIYLSCLKKRFFKFLPFFFFFFSFISSITKYIKVTNKRVVAFQTLDDWINSRNPLLPLSAPRWSFFFPLLLFSPLLHLFSIPIYLAGASSPRSVHYGWLACPQPRFFPPFVFFLRSATPLLRYPPSITFRKINKKNRSYQNLDPADLWKNKWSSKEFIIPLDLKKKTSYRIDSLVCCNSIQ